MISVLLTSSAELEAQLPRLTSGALGELGEAAAPEDHAAASAKRDPLDQRRTLTARAALRLLAAAHRGDRLQDAARLGIRRSCQQCGGPHGRPELHGVSLSSSSSARHVLAGAAAPGQQVGVDLEAIPERLAPGFAEYALHRAERAALRRLSPDSRTRSLIESWVLKEAVLKAAGVGLNHPPAELLLGDQNLGSRDPGTRWHGHAGPERLRWAPVAETPDARVQGLWGCLIPAPPGYAAAVAARTPEEITDITTSWGA
ncbi:4-phosphopantetheinyl transferase family protein [Nesterenkonia sp. E16_7]|uniref:4'-phosphopantetheinyl transferase family protein n=1 Tax=unclassified Nesterenkonia TaxID=2629769 RepID=UPI001A9266A0|nr:MULTISPECIES: 4'-phosphopantetheinyl transferase superfamily protein [unclassified Nesterenkonia]MBO0595351.1 4-phosphopantetheinyl transferase family protein [Nesterenkonia sp. E16_10]MBO0599201.1 4-phosphopantetheinyl transferase family protein [Nesterenkonia sp. E16_7]